jgi:two-component system sensor histidine kinase ChvG
MAVAMFKILRLVSRSLAGKVLTLATFFLIVPVILYARFSSADAERQTFMLRNLQAEGRLATEVLEPILSRSGNRAPQEAAKAVQDLGSSQVQVKLLLQPAGTADTLFLVAANPPIDPTARDRERQHLTDAGILEKLDESCASDRPLAVHYASDGGGEELLTSVSSFHTQTGCWIIVTSYNLENVAGSSLGRPFSDAPEVRLAMGLYGLMALLTILTVAGTLIDIRAFSRLARRIRAGGVAGDKSFAAVAAIPELLPVAREFDRMVTTLDASARAMREAAEDNAHALKAPIGIITQSLEPLRRATSSDIAGQQAVVAVEKALDRLSTLVNAARRLDETAAALIGAQLGPVDLSRLARDMAQAFSHGDAVEGISVVARAPHPAIVLATEDSLETVLENLIDNAVGFSPPGGEIAIQVTRRAGWVTLCVEDQGPGVPDDRLAAIFRRNVSWRPAARRDLSGALSNHHSGIGLAVVRRTAEMLGGAVRAENRAEGGLRVILILPVA